jgi:hypothetical protein
VGDGVGDAGKTGTGADQRGDAAVGEHLEILD